MPAANQIVDFLQNRPALHRDDGSPDNRPACFRQCLAISNVKELEQAHVVHIAHAVAAEQDSNGLNGFVDLDRIVHTWLNGTKRFVSLFAPRCRWSSIQKGTPMKISVAIQFIASLPAPTTVGFLS